MLHALPPCALSPNLMKHLKESERRKRSLLRAHPRKGVVPVGLSRVGRIEIDQVLATVLGNSGGNPIYNDPCGSMTVNPSPFRMSWSAIVSNRVLFPVPVFPMT